jgi:RNA polymerase sigma-70 factor (ECF subfamily)
VPTDLMPTEAQNRTMPPAATPRAVEQMFQQAVLTHSKRMLAVARGIVGNRACPEDVVQQALTNLYQHRDRYDWRDPGGLIRRAVVNEAIRILRHPRMVRVADDHPGDHRSPATRMIDQETIDKVRAAIGQLPTHFRAALILCEYENMSYAQISQVLGVSMPQVKTWLHRGRRQLAGMLEEFMQPPPRSRGEKDVRRHPSVRMPPLQLAAN